MPENNQLTVGNLGESGLLDRILPRLRGAAALLGPGDDAALIAAPGGKFVITVDTLVQDQDFRLRWPNGFESSGFDVGWKSAAQNLSDVNAMGAIATAAVISLTLPHGTPVSWVEDLAEGFSAAVRDLGASYCAIAGGDLGRGGELSITAAVTGMLAMGKPVLRSGAKPGDLVAINGVLGVAAAGLALLDAPASHLDWSEQERALVFGQRRPSPPLGAGPEAARAGATAMMDLSDGLLKDGRRMAVASNVKIEIDSASLRSYAAPLQTAAQVLSGDPMSWVLEGGEDHGLLATFPRGLEIPVGFKVIGEVSPRNTGDAAVLLDGIKIAEGGGYDHFRARSSWHST
ncbi:thiamine-phosphate kinase [Paeniglutamicibacter psychrophenolicus]|uniref:thiamine-phosphate kinase n=1 Tax=Paeniglutamicibacter psychrophenolicus TaxID=257454 RepID=UPI0027D85B18|nr:thiamine-phosphate kinase [Paeniglutamicibacter psychrophenolicus]